MEDAGGAGPADPASTPPGPVARAFARLVVRLADAAIRAVTRLLGTSPTTGRERISQAELRDLVAANVVLDREERRIIDEVIAAGGSLVREVMVPRTEVAFLRAELTREEAARQARSDWHSRFPVVDGTHDDVIGFVHLRDLLIPDGGGPRTVGELAREVKRLPGSKHVLAALSEMRRERHHLAVVVDEYGGTAGIVTLEDLIEELVGEIHDEYDASPEPLPVGGATPAEVDGLLNLADFADRTGFALPPGPYETVGGFVMAALGRLPAVGDEVAVAHPGGTPAGRPGWRLVVLALDGRRVDRVGVAPQPVQAAPPQSVAAAPSHAVQAAPPQPAQVAPPHAVQAAPPQPAQVPPAHLVPEQVQVVPEQIQAVPEQA
jgi:magnesium and cobalt exporter, CNNM family